MACNTRSGHNEVPAPPPPPPPTPAELLATLVEGQWMLNEAMQTMAQQNRGGRHARQGGEANQYSNFKDFKDTKLLGILNANRKIRKRTDTDVAFTREYSRVSIFHREREFTN